MKSITPSSFCKFSDLVGAFLEHWLQSSRRAEFCLHEVPMKRTVTVFLREYATRQAITMLWLALILVTTLLVLRLAKLLRLWMKGNRLPGPPFRIPLGLLSATCKVGDLSNFSIYLGALHKQYGPIVRIWLGPMHLLVSINDHEIMESMMVLSKDRVPATRKALDLAFGKDSIFISTYKKARRTRFSLHRALNGNVIEKVHSISIQICNQLDRWTTPGLSGMEFEIEVFSQHIVFAVLGAILFGDSFLVWPSSKEFEKLLFGISEKACYWARYPVSPFWTNGFKQYKEMCLRAQGLVEELLTFSNYLKDDASSSMSKQKYKQFYEGILLFSKGLETSCAQEVLEGDVQDIRENLFGMMYHGCHTMATTLGCVIARLAQNPEIQAKVHSEVDLVCEERSPPSAADIKKMHYLLAVVYECARLLPDRHLLQRCAIDHDLKVAPDTVIPAGAIIALPVKVMGMDAEIWGHDVHEFNPDRFLKYASTLGGRTTCMLTTPLCNPLKNSTDGTDICNTLGNSTGIFIGGNAS